MANCSTGAPWNQRPRPGNDAADCRRQAGPRPPVGAPGRRAETCASSSSATSCSTTAGPALIAGGGDPLRSLRAALGRPTTPSATWNAHRRRRRAMERKPSPRAAPRVVSVLQAASTPWRWPTTIPATTAGRPSPKPWAIWKKAGIAAFGGGRNRPRPTGPRGSRKTPASPCLAYNEFKPRAFEAGADWPGSPGARTTRWWRISAPPARPGADLVIPLHALGLGARAAARRAPARPGPLDDRRRGRPGGRGHPTSPRGSKSHRDKPIVHSLGNFASTVSTCPPPAKGWGAA